MRIILFLFLFLLNDLFALDGCGTKNITVSLDINKNGSISYTSEVPTHGWYYYPKYTLTIYEDGYLVSPKTLYYDSSFYYAFGDASKCNEYFTSTKKVQDDDYFAPNTSWGFQHKRNNLKACIRFNFKPGKTYSIGARFFADADCIQHDFSIMGTSIPLVGLIVAGIVKAVDDDKCSQSYGDEAYFDNLGSRIREDRCWYDLKRNCHKSCVDDDKYHDIYFTVPKQYKLGFNLYDAKYKEKQVIDSGYSSSGLEQIKIENNLKATLNDSLLLNINFACNRGENACSKLSDNNKKLKVEIFKCTEGILSCTAKAKIKEDEDLSFGFYERKSGVESMSQTNTITTIEDYTGSFTLGKLPFNYNLPLTFLKDGIYFIKAKTPEIIETSTFDVDGVKRSPTKTTATFLAQYETAFFIQITKDNSTGEIKITKPKESSTQDDSTKKMQLNLITDETNAEIEVTRTIDKQAKEALTQKNLSDEQKRILNSVLYSSLTDLNAKITYEDNFDEITTENKKTKKYEKLEKKFYGVSNWVHEGARFHKLQWNEISDDKVFDYKIKLKTLKPGNYEASFGGSFISACPFGFFNSNECKYNQLVSSVWDGPVKINVRPSELVLQTTKYQQNANELKDLELIPICKDNKCDENILTKMKIIYGELKVVDAKNDNNFKIIPLKELDISYKNGSFTIEKFALPINTKAELKLLAAYNIDNSYFNKSKEQEISICKSFNPSSSKLFDLKNEVFNKADDNGKIYCEVPVYFKVGDEKRDSLEYTFADIVNNKALIDNQKLKIVNYKTKYYTGLKNIIPFEGTNSENGELSKDLNPLVVHYTFLNKNLLPSNSSDKNNYLFSPKLDLKYSKSNDSVDDAILRTLYDNFNIDTNLNIIDNKNCLENNSNKSVFCFNKSNDFAMNLAHILSDPKKFFNGKDEFAIYIKPEFCTEFISKNAFENKKNNGGYLYIKVKNYNENLWQKPGEKDTFYTYALSGAKLLMKNPQELYANYENCALLIRDVNEDTSCTIGAVEEIKFYDFANMKLNNCNNATECTIIDLYKKCSNCICFSNSKVSKITDFAKYRLFEMPKTNGNIRVKIAYPKIIKKGDNEHFLTTQAFNVKIGNTEIKKNGKDTVASEKLDLDFLFGFTGIFFNNFPTMNQKDNLLINFKDLTSIDPDNKNGKSRIGYFLSKDYLYQLKNKSKNKKSANSNFNSQASNDFSITKRIKGFFDDLSDASKTISLTRQTADDSYSNSIAVPINKCEYSKDINEPCFDLDYYLSFIDKKDNYFNYDKKNCGLQFRKEGIYAFNKGNEIKDCQYDFLNYKYILNEDGEFECEKDSKNKCKRYPKSHHSSSSNMNFFVQFEGKVDAPSVDASLGTNTKNESSANHATIIKEPTNSAKKPLKPRIIFENIDKEQLQKVEPNSINNPKFNSR